MMDIRIFMTGFFVVVILEHLHASSARVRSSYLTSCEGRGTPRKFSELPCDIDGQSFCTEPGDAYPRHEVRRFVNDNQGMMRRMYGDLRHLSVLRSEMQWSSFNDDAQQQQQQRVDHPMSATSLADDPDDDDDDDPPSPPTTSPTTTTTPAATSTSHVDDDDDVNSTVGNETMTSSHEDNHVTASVSTVDAIGRQSVAGQNSSGNVETDKGINACPTKQEVVAPYWAVNTRGRTVAIVNDPPYVQHIHWEKCSHENQQMLCRDGCRCEQQYRLQRLLAFDPSCDCKGVFMDWFLMPSCCVCKCYGLTYNDTAALTRQNVSTSSGRRQGRRRRQRNPLHSISATSRGEEERRDMDWILNNTLDVHHLEEEESNDY